VSWSTIHHAPDLAQRGARLGEKRFPRAAVYSGHDAGDTLGWRLLGCWCVRARRKGDDGHGPS
jgi:hypothetical protein